MSHSKTKPAIFKRDLLSKETSIERRHSASASSSNLTETGNPGNCPSLNGTGGSSSRRHSLPGETLAVAAGNHSGCVL